MLDATPQRDPDAELPGARRRTLLGKLRDLDLHAGRIAVSTDLSIALEGCSTLDESLERPLRYRLRAERGSEVLEIRFGEGGLTLLRLDDQGRPLASRRLTVLGGEDGLAFVPELRARLDPERAGPREVERFLRRLVRAVYGRRASA